MKVDFTDAEVDRLIELLDVAVKAEGVAIVEKCASIILKLKVAKAEEMNPKKVTDVEDEAVTKKVARKSSNESRTAQS